ATSASPGQNGPFTLFLDCGTTSPLIDVRNSVNQVVASGSTVNLGSLNVGSTIRYSLTIKNAATAATASGLNVGRLLMAGDFSVNRQIIPVLPRGRSFGPVIVSLGGSTTGTKNGTLTIPSDE